MALRSKNITLRTTIVAASTLIVFASTGPLYATEVQPKTGSSGPKKITHCRAIHKPGSYVVTKNLTATGSCIVIKANNVTLDLGGFVLSGPGRFEESEGITNKGVNRQGIVIRNGTVRDFSSGIELDPSDATVVENVRAINNGYGILVGKNSIVNSNTTINNGVEGITVGLSSTISNNIVIRSGIGIFASEGSSIITGNISRDHEGSGIRAGEGSTVNGNTVQGNGGSGISVQCPSAVIGNTATSNGSSFGDPNLLLDGAGCLDVNNVVGPS
jgi:hypothetical protein